MNSRWNLKLQKDDSIKLTNNKSIIKKTAITIVLLTSVSFNLAFAKDNKSPEGLNKIYHVYIGDKYIGAVSDEKAIEQIIEEKEQEVSQQYSQYTVDGNSNVTVVPEQVFSYETSDTETLGKLKEELVVEAEAFAVQVDGNVAAYVANEDEFNKALDLLKLEFVSKKELKKFKEKQQAGTKTNSSKDKVNVLEISLKENINIARAKVEPSKILTAEKLLKFLKSGTLHKETYTVKSGDVLSTIANSHGLTTKELLKLNPGLKEDTLLQIGQKLNVTVEKPLVNVKYVYEKTASETIPFKEVVKYDKNLPKGEKKIVQEGSNGKKQISYQITEVNGKQVEKKVLKEKIISKPQEKIIILGTKVISSRGTGEFLWPTNGGYVSSHVGHRWGRMHKGIDIARPSNYNIKASDNGVVIFAGHDGTYGNKIVIDHKNGYQTVYAHLSSIKVSVGQTVSRGSVIGIMGSTGRSTGVHLHFEVYKNGALINPLSVL